MAKAILTYKVTTNLNKHITDITHSTRKTLADLEQELSAYCGLKVDTIKKYRRGVIDPSLPVALKIAEYFGKSVEEIWSLKEEGTE